VALHKLAIRYLCIRNFHRTYDLSIFETVNIPTLTEIDFSGTWCSLAHLHAISDQLVTVRMNHTKGYWFDTSKLTPSSWSRLQVLEANDCQSLCNVIIDDLHRTAATSLTKLCIRPGPKTTWGGSYDAKCWATRFFSYMSSEKPKDLPTDITANSVRGWPSLTYLDVGSWKHMPYDHRGTDHQSSYDLSLLPVTSPLLRELYLDTTLLSIDIIRPLATSLLSLRVLELGAPPTEVDRDGNGNMLSVYHDGRTWHNELNKLRSSLPQIKFVLVNQT
jgi:hypothetical protein